MVYLFSTFIYKYLDSWRAFGKEKHVTFNVTLFEQLVFNACITIKALNNMIRQVKHWNEAIHYVSPCPCFSPILWKSHAWSFHFISFTISYSKWNFNFKLQIWVVLCPFFMYWVCIIYILFVYCQAWIV